VIELTSIFFGVSILLYCLLAGADFGAGILEVFAGKNREQKIKVITHAMGPVWEANHMWMILAVVIFMVAFPRGYTELSTLFHIPITIMLFGMILRGCAFTFRHYDAIEDDSEKMYSFIFAVSSTVTPFMLGVIAGGTILTRYHPVTDLTYWNTYVDPWFNLFCAAMGLFTCSLFTFLAAIYLIDESPTDDLRRSFTRHARLANIACVVTGGFVFLAAWMEGYPLMQQFLGNVYSTSAIIIGTLLLWPLWRALHRGQTLISRFLAAGQVTLVLLGWFGMQYPDILRYDPASGLEALTFYNTAAPEATLRMLLGALGVGCLFILPALAYLFHIFKYSPSPREGTL
jgi:cytochrome d ubiquinol oxidase subunit II